MVSKSHSLKTQFLPKFVEKGHVDKYFMGKNDGRIITRRKYHKFHGNIFSGGYLT